MLKTISEYVLNSKHTITAKEVAKYANTVLDSSYFIDKVRSIIIKELKLSFKRVKSRSNNIDLNLTMNVEYLNKMAGGLKVLHLTKLFQRLLPEIEEHIKNGKRPMPNTSIDRITR